MGHVGWALDLLAVAILVATWWINRRRTRELKFQIERHGLRLRSWRRVGKGELLDPWRCPECLLTAHGHWAKVGHQQWHDQASGDPDPDGPWDSVSAEFMADRAAGTPPLADAGRPELDP